MLQHYKLPGNTWKADQWIAHYKTTDYQGQWSVLPLRSVCGHPSVIHASPNLNMYDDTPFLKQSPYFQHVLHHFNCPLASVRLMRLAAGATILEHTDDMGEKEVRIHIPVQTHPDVEFWLNHQRVTMQVGDVWLGDFRLPHSVSNKSPIDRIHLVIDAQYNDWLADRLHTIQLA